MKKTIIVLLALFLALPAVSFAGSVTSRWDMTIGGYVKFDFGYADGAVGADYAVAPRGSWRQNQTLNDQYGNWYSAAGETRLNFLIKGPDGGGAKTSAFIEGDFRGQGIAGGGANNSAASTGASYGSFTLRHAFMKLDWPNATLTAGQTWQRWGFIPSFAAVGSLYGFATLGPFNKGLRQPRLDYEQRFGPGFAAALAVVANTNTFATNNGQVVNQNTRSDYPWVEGEFRYNTDKCGKIGPYGLMAGIGGFVGQSKIAYQSAFNADGVPIRYTDQTVRAWGVALKGFIPIIPEKNKNKKGALAIGGNIFYGQNMTDWFGNGTAPYVGAGSAFPVAGVPGIFNSPRFEAPTSFGGWGQVSYWFTDKFFADGYFGYTRNNLSDPYMIANPNAPESITHLVFNVNYDLNQAVRFGLEYAWVKTQYNGKSLTGVDALGNRYYLDSKGSFNTLRLGAYYFF